MPSVADMRNERMVAALLVVCIIGSVLAIGTVHVPTLLVLAVVVAAAVVLSRRLRRKGKRSWPGPAVVLAALGVFSLLQALPLPAGFVAAIAPNAADVHARALLPLGEAAPTWVSLSLDQGASLVEALKWMVYAGVFVVADILGERRGTVWTVRVVFVAALLAALATLAHGLAGLTKVYGVFQPSYQPEIWHVGPLLNPNSLAGYLNLGAMCGIGVGLHRDHKLPYHLAWPAVALIIAVGVLSASRGGVLLLVAGLLTLAVVLMTRKVKGKRSRRPELYAMAAAVVVGLGLALLGGTQDSWSELYDKNVSKLSLAWDAVPMIQDHPIFGVGRGAFESAFSAHRYGYENRVFAHAENWVTQWVAEWGIPVTLAAGVALAWQLRPSRMDLRREVGLCGYLGIGMLLVHNLVDLGLELPGMCVALFSLLGALHGATRRDERKRSRRRRIVSSRVATYGYAGAVAAFAVLVLLWGRHDVASSRRDLVAQHGHLSQQIDRYVEAEPTERDGARAALHADVEALRQALRAAMLRHPAEPYFPLLGGTLAWRLKEGELLEQELSEDDPLKQPMPWIQRALERGMGNGRTHLLLAQILVERDLFPQARLELRLALTHSPELAPSAVRTALRSARSFEQLKETLPSGEQQLRMLSALASYLREHDDANSTALRAACDRAALEYDANLIAPRVRLADDVIDALRKQDEPDPRCADKTACEAEVLAHASHLERVAPELSHGAQLRARLLAAADALEQADTILATQCSKMSDRKACLTERARIASAGPDALFDGAVEALLDTGCGNASECATLHHWLGNRYQTRHNWPLAFRHHNKAAHLNRTPQGWLTAARAASKAGLHGQAVEALERVVRHRDHRHDAKLKAWLADERAQVAGAVVRGAEP